jgi:hypothetical protein
LALLDPLARGPDISNACQYDGHARVIIWVMYLVSVLARPRIFRSMPETELTK